MLAILLSNKIGFKSKSVIGDKGHYIVIKVRFNSPNIRVAKYMHLPSDSQIYEANIHRWGDTKIGRDFNTLLLVMDGKCRWKFKKGNRGLAQHLNNHLNLKNVQNMSSNNRRIHILLKFTRINLQDRLCRLQ